MSDRRRHDTPNEEWKRELAGSMRRLNEQLKNEQWRGVVGESVRALGEHIVRAATQEMLDKAERRQARKEARRLRKRQQAAARTSTAEGYASLVAAVAIAAVIFLIPREWWLIFIALPLMFRGVRILSLKSEAKSIPADVPAVDSRTARIDEVCDKLLAALKDAPQVVRELLSAPEQTVNALRTSYHELLKRENALRALTNPEEAARLDRERADLEHRIARESDDVIRTRLQAALVALDHQRTQHAEVLRNANRLEAERTRLGYTLDGLYAQVMRVRTAEAGSEDVVGAGLRQSLDQLRDEVGALADALEQVNQPVPSTDQQPSPVRQPERTRS